MEALRQILTITLMNLRAVPQRWGSSLVIVVGMAAVVSVMTVVLAMSTGYLDEMTKTGRPDRAVVTQGGSANETQSHLTRDAVATIMDAPDVKRDADGKPIASANLFVYPPSTKKSDGLIVGATLDAVGPKAFVLMPQIKLVSGRMFRPGLHELIVGRMMPPQFQGYDVGDKLHLPQGDWTIVGAFQSGGDQHEAELIGDNETVMSGFRRPAFNSVVVMLNSANAFDSFKDSLTTNPTLNVDVMRETDYFAKLSKVLNDFLTLVARAVGAIMGLGAIFAAVNTMYAAVSARQLEIATLRAIGFGAAPVVISVLAEAILLSVLGAAIGVSAVWLAFNGRVVVSDWSIYTMSVSPALLGWALLGSVAIGFVGGLFPAIRVARGSVAEALRAS